MTRHSKRPRDANQLAKRIVDLATGAATEDTPTPLTAAQEFAWSGGLKRCAARHFAAGAAGGDCSEGGEAVGPRLNRPTIHTATTVM